MNVSMKLIDSLEKYIEECSTVSDSADNEISDSNDVACTPEKAYYQNENDIKSFEVEENYCFSEAQKAALGASRKGSLSHQCKTPQKPSVCLSKFNRHGA